jgi:hypothetical protein
LGIPLKRELLLALFAEYQAEAEACFCQAIEVAYHQQRSLRSYRGR